jgi:hypothetical protein
MHLDRNRQFLLIGRGMVRCIDMKQKDVTWRFTGVITPSPSCDTFATTTVQGYYLFPADIPSLLLTAEKRCMFHELSYDPQRFITSRVDKWSRVETYRITQRLAIEKYKVAQSNAARKKRLSKRRLSHSSGNPDYTFKATSRKAFMAMANASLPNSEEGWAERRGADSNTGLRCDLEPTLRQLELQLDELTTVPNCSMAKKSSNPRSPSTTIPAMKSRPSMPYNPSASFRGMRTHVSAESNTRPASAAHLPVMPVPQEHSLTDNWFLSQSPLWVPARNALAQSVAHLTIKSAKERAVDEQIQESMAMTWPAGRLRLREDHQMMSVLCRSAAPLAGHRQESRRIPRLNQRERLPAAVSTGTRLMTSSSWKATALPI